MKITPTNISNTPLTPKQPIPTPTTAVREAGAESVGTDGNVYTPSPEWLRLVDQIRQQPEVREDRIRAALERLHEGYYTTPSSAMKTAEAMQISGD